MLERKRQRGSFGEAKEVKGKVGETNLQGKKLNMVRRKDSFWEYAEELENGFICKFCEKGFDGGISAIKSHLSGVVDREAIQLEAKQALLVIDTPTKGSKNVPASSNVLECESFSSSSSSHMPNLCKGQDMSVSRTKSYLSGVSDIEIQICLQVPEAVQLEAKQAIDNPTKRAKNVAASSNVLECESVSSSSSLHMRNLCMGQDMSMVDKQLAKFIMSSGICLDAIQSPRFKDFVNGVAEHGPSYELPSSLILKSRLIPNIKKEVEEYVSNVINIQLKQVVP
ncbi:uncharacterized protein LOC132191504 isoform X1 [Corylus avellana]|uniref:uncharacterized protein LOC132191504 isoform X1 n=1 Tax=Corylus avellana TaxID=13451 RepID=UPI00286A1A49|nr:uncharacterized protein LOC132191504 isoform X1 [Corylus avellana]